MAKIQQVKEILLQIKQCFDFEHQPSFCAKQNSLPLINEALSLIEEEKCEYSHVCQGDPQSADYCPLRGCLVEYPACEEHVEPEYKCPKCGEVWVTVPPLKEKDEDS